ncbi:MAG: hypothetical protein NVS3B12_14150 [Acidimicrobiales bacterium]
MADGIDLLGCEYLGGCPSIGTRVLNKVELHFDRAGLTVAIAPQGLFTIAAPRAVVVLRWAEITELSATTRPVGTNALRRLWRRFVDVVTIRLDLPHELVVGTATWTMRFGVRVEASELSTALVNARASAGRVTT